MSSWEILLAYLENQEKNLSFWSNEILEILGKTVDEALLQFECKILKAFSKNSFKAFFSRLCLAYIVEAPKISTRLAFYEGSSASIAALNAIIALVAIVKGENDLESVTSDIREKLESYGKKLQEILNRGDEKDKDHLFV